jgi:hypothetical protein
MLKGIKILAALLGVASFMACEKKISEIQYEGGTNPVLTTNKAAIVLAFLTKDDEAVTFSWTNPNYRFSSGTSSHDVSYTLEFDTSGVDFKGAHKKSMVIGKDLSKTFTQDEFNALLLNDLAFKAGVAQSIDVRIRSALTNDALPLYSSVMKYTVTPYSIPPKVIPPVKLYITGSATAGSWMTGGDPELVTQRFTRSTTDTTQFVINSIPIVGGGSYLFVPVYGDWSNKFGYDGNGNANNVNEDNFRAGGNDIKAPVLSGNYKIEVDFQRGKFKLTKL